MSRKQPLSNVSLSRNIAKLFERDTFPLPNLLTFGLLAKSRTQSNQSIPSSASGLLFPGPVSASSVLSELRSFTPLENRFWSASAQIELQKGRNVQGNLQMIAPVVVAAMVVAGGAIAGGAMSSRAANKAAATDRAQQQAFAEHGVQWRVEDAKRAGLHPLYAIGANTPQYTPTARVGQGDLGRGVARAAQAIGSGIEAQGRQQASAEVRSLALRQARADAGISETDLAMMQLELSEKTRAVQENNNQQDQLDVPQGMVEGVPSEVTSSEIGNKSRTAGTHPMFKKVRIVDTKWGHVNAAIVDSDDTSEGISEFGPLMASIFGTIALWLQEEPRYVKENWMSKKIDKYRVKAASVVRSWFKKNRPEVYRDPGRTSSGKIK